MRERREVRPYGSQRWRRRWLAVHLWLGLSLGVVFVLLGLTGSALVFYRDIDGWLNPQVVVERQAVPEHGYHKILDAIHAVHPQRTRAWRLEVPNEHASNRAYTARYYFAEEKRGQSFAPLMVTVNPYTLKVTDSRLWGDTVMTFIYDLHYELLLDGVGSTVLGIIGIGLLLLLGAGVYLWWPSLASLPRALSLKRHASAARRNYDIHKISGIYGLILSLVLVGTGVMLAKPEWFKPSLQRLAPVFQGPTLVSNTDAQSASLSLDQAVQVALATFPDAQVRWIEAPDGVSGVYMIRVQRPGEPSARFPQTYVWLDQYSGQVLAVRDAQLNSSSDSILTWLHPLHNGEAFGLFGRWLAFVAGLIPLALFVTGLIRWQQKRRARRMISVRHAQAGTRVS